MHHGQCCPLHESSTEVTSVLYSVLQMTDVRVMEVKTVELLSFLDVPFFADYGLTTNSKRAHLR